MAALWSSTKLAHVKNVRVALAAAGVAAAAVAVVAAMVVVAAAEAVAAIEPVRSPTSSTYDKAPSGRLFHVRLESRFNTSTLADRRSWWPLLAGDADFQNRSGRNT